MVEFNPISQLKFQVNSIEKQVFITFETSIVCWKMKCWQQNKSAIWYKFRIKSRLSWLKTHRIAIIVDGSWWLWGEWFSHSQSSEYIVNRMRVYCTTPWISRDLPNCRHNKNDSTSTPIENICVNLHYIEGRVCYFSVYEQRREMNILSYRVFVFSFIGLIHEIQEERVHKRRHLLNIRVPTISCVSFLLGCINHQQCVAQTNNILM